ncbi:MAG: valine--tRNA ligase [Alphaproteobacteria bacterium]|nr:valine--tRNA ligase [Alphaproteobacteria bacterium]
MKKELEKRFSFKDIEKELVHEWNRKGIFKFKKSGNKKPFCIMMPPPNVTGSLHMGHALTFTLQDILIRFYKKLGRDVLWQPGTDHAGIATEIVVEKQLIKDKKNSKKKIGREAFLKKIWDWKKVSGNKIVDQLKRLGTSVDWSISRFTLDDGLSESVKKVFIELFNKGLIYQDKRLVNWDTVLETAVSDLEVNQKEVDGSLWFIKYKILENSDYLTVATTRPETMFGDTAIAIHPQNKKLNKFIGKNALIPLSKKSIPIIGDEYADPKKGSGAVKITPAHDFNDFLIGKKHHLEFVNIFDKNAKLNENVPKKFFGLDRYKARKLILKYLDESNLVEKTIKNKMVIPIGDRSGSVIEPLITTQWFVDSKKLCKDVKKVIRKNELKFFPASWMNTFKYWIDNIEPWCISRQIWWGHRIPVWYSDKNTKIAAENIKEARKILKKTKPDEIITHQDDDVLDTWFSSALWPFSTLGWPNDKNLLNKFYPTNVLVTGFDIIFFWVARMIMMGLFFMKNIPFQNVYIHPLVRDEKGEKMSKSKGNVIDPLELIELYGADSLRFTLVNLSTQGRDIKLSNKVVENSRNFITKLWNVARFSQFNNFSLNKNYDFKKNRLSINEWIFQRYYETQLNVIKHLKNYKFNLLVKELYHFIWNDFCDIYIELSKIYIKDKQNFEEISNNFSYIFRLVLNLINPVIPFVSEKISKDLNYIKSNLYTEQFSSKFERKILTKKTSEFYKIIEFIRNLRNVLKNKKNAEFDLIIFNIRKVKWIENNQSLIKLFFNINRFIYSNTSENEFDFVSSTYKFGIRSEDKKNNEDELKKQIKFYEKEVKFFENKLKNKNFIAKAPLNIVNENKAKLKDALKNLELLKK